MKTFRNPKTLHADERGIALVTVIIISVILMTLVAASTGFALTSLNSSRRDQDWNAALPAAEAGIDDYLYRLSRDSGYWQYNATTPAPDGNKAFTEWVKVPGAADSYFRYYIDSSLMSTQGIVKIRSSGRVNGVVRTIEALFRRRGFLDYLYFTEYETTDPFTYTGTPYFSDEAHANCRRHYYDLPGRNSRCLDIYFIGADTIKGPLHSNDALLLSGSPNFQGETSTSWDGTCPSSSINCSPSTNRYRGTATPVFARAGDPAFAPPLTMPPTNLAIRNYADSTVGGAGCLFTGPTKIVFNSNGTMTVTSPYTQVSNCQVGASKPLPSNGVIYVQSVPASPSDPNYRAACSVPSGNPLGYPVAGDVNAGQYGCFDGDVFVSGALDGQVTVAAQDSVIITGSLTYQGGISGNDLLGLIADNNVEVYHPVNSSDANLLPVGLTVSTIYAAILTIKHSFRVQTHKKGNPLGTLTLFGAISQLYRGPVGTFSGSSVSSGYSKDYTYDQKLKYTSPPHFLDPVASAWGIKTWAECKPANPPGATSCT